MKFNKSRDCSRSEFAWRPDSLPFNMRIMESDGPKRQTVEQLAEEFVERYRRGERPTLSEFTARDPAHADEIRDLFPALVMMEQIAPDSEAGLLTAVRASLHRRPIEHPER